MNLSKKAYEKIEANYYEYCKELEKAKKQKEDEQTIAWLDGYTWGIAYALNVIDGKTEWEMENE